MTATQTTIIHQQSIPVTGLELFNAISQDPAAWQGKTIELWLYQNLATRQALTKRFEAIGISAVIRSAYKPLLHWVIEDVHHHGLDEDLVRVDISYPVDACTNPLRFLSEAYPLDTLFPDVPLQWTAQAPSEAHEYAVILTYLDETTRTFTVFAPNERFVDHLGHDTLAPTGFLRVRDNQTGQVLQAHPLQTEIQAAYRSIMQVIKGHAWGERQPYFGRLHIRVDVPGAEVFGPTGDFLASTYEALHEDLYFSILEFFQQYSGCPLGDRRLQPGQIVPDIRATESLDISCLSLQIVVMPSGASFEPLAVLPQTSSDTEHLTAIERVSRPLTHQQVDEVLDQIPGDTFEFESFQGRVLRCKHRTGSRPGIVVTGGQHANESTGIVGALRSAQWLSNVDRAHFAVVPLENPDGYQLFHEYCAIHPRHINHAARYTALGDDQEYRDAPPWYERKARMHALEITEAQLHLSLHGYPAHEWTRPFSGYLPRGFELWSIPKGFFLIIRYRKGWEQIANALLDELTHGLCQVPGFSAYNADQLNRYEMFSGKVPFEVNRGIPCLLVPNDQQTPGVVIVTEIPDETIHGQAFRFAQDIHTETVKLASSAWWRLMAR